MCNICVLRSSDFFAVMYILWSKQNLQFSKVNGKKINDKINVVYRDYWSYFFWKPWKPYNKQKFNSGILYPVCLHQYTCISIFEKWAWWDPLRQMEHVRQYGHRTKTFHGWKILPRALTRTPHFFHCFKGKRKVPPLLPIVYKMETNFYVRLFPENNYTINLPCLLKRNNRFNMVVENV